MISLNGIWDFAFTEKPLENIDLRKTGFTTAAPVPGCFDTLPEYFNARGTGIYRRKVCCGGRIRLRLGAIGLRGIIFWDGKKAACCEHPFTPEYFTLDAGKEGEHELVIAVENIFHEEASSLFHQYYDFYGSGGIYREVSMESLPEWYAERIQVIPLSAETGEVKIRFFMEGDVPETYTVKLRFDTETKYRKIELRGKTAEIVLKVPDFKLWSPETPFLHQVKIVTGLWEKEVSFGIRILSADHGELKLNGKKLKLIGYNRHDSHPQFGYAVPQTLTASDLHQIKAQGCNFIRGCHYPQSESMLELCDRMGLLVWDEALGWGNREEHLADPVFRQRQAESVRLMVQESINHPSIIMWGFLNECASDTQAGHEIISLLRETILQEDPSRPITFASSRGVKDICLDLVDIVSFNTYPGWYGGINEVRPFHLIGEAFRELIEYADSVKCGEKPMIISEIGTAAMIGDRSGERWSEDYQADLIGCVLENILRSPRIMGLAIWQFSNTRSYTATSGFLVRPCGMNNKGLVDEYRRPKLAWRTVREILKKYRNG